MRAKNTNKVEELSNLIKVSVIVVIFILFVYVLTALITAKGNSNVKNNESEIEEASTKIDYDQTIIGSMFDLDYKDYYVLIYKRTARNATLIKNVLTTYKGKENSIKIFYVDLDDALNKNYYSEDESNKNAKDATEIKVKDYALIRFKNNKISEYYETLEEINTKLK